MTEETSPDSNGPQQTTAERLIARAEEFSELRAELITSWANAKHWSCHDGIALAWTVEPRKAISSKLPRSGTPSSLPQDAHPFLEQARSNQDPEFASDRVQPLRFIAWAHGAGLAFHSDWYHAAVRARSEEPRSHAPRRDLLTRREKLVQLWALAPFWRVEEGAALAYDLDPEKAIGSSSTGYGNPWIRDHKAASHLLNLAFRAAQVGKLSRQPAPVKFMKWARDMGVEFDQVWWDSVLPEEDETEVPKSEKTAAQLKTREQDSLLKLVGGMAIGGYRWNRDLERSRVTKEISDDLAEAGVPLHSDTILKWLRKSAELIPKEDT